MCDNDLTSIAHFDMLGYQAGIPDFLGSFATALQRVEQWQTIEILVT
jgi:hypothetical protein